MVKAIPRQPITYLVEQFKIAKLKGDPERMFTMFNALLWQYKQNKKIHKGKTQKLAKTITKLKLKLSEVD